MATLTSNISNKSVTVNGSNNTGVMISWTLPIVPAGGIVTARTLTGVATANMKKGSATIKVDGTTVSSGTPFTINFDINSDKTSVSTVVTGGNRNASGTVTFSNLVYTVTYTELAVTYTVTFVNWDGSVLKTEEVESGSAATAPSNPSREGYEFIGWDKTFSNITSDLIVTAQYSIKTYIVKFYSDTTLLKTETVEHGKSATAPSSPVKEGYTFIGWDKDFTNITSDLSIYALYEINKYTVTFVDYDGTTLKTEEVEYGGSATAPESPSREEYEFIGWDIDFSNVISDLTVVAQYAKPSILQIKENGNWMDIGKIYKRISGNWVEQPSFNLNTLFDTNIKYNIAKSNPTAILYSDGTLIFQDSDIADSSHGDIVETYVGWDVDKYSWSVTAPWFNSRNETNNIIINTIISPKATSYWFRSYGLITSLDLTNFDTTNVTSTKGMFYVCSSLSSLDLSNFDTSNVTDMNGMFYMCKRLTSLDLSNFNTSNVTDMSDMFHACSALTSLDLSSFDTSNVTIMSSMFGSCSALTSLDLSNFNTSNVTDMSYMFYGCTSLQTIYVKDETAKTKIEASTGFPTGVSVIIGKPN